MELGGDVFTHEIGYQEVHILRNHYVMLAIAIVNTNIAFSFKACGLRVLLFTAVSAVKRKVAKPEPDTSAIY